MAPLSRDRISVDLRGLRAALFAQARSRGVTPSDLVRGVLTKALGGAAEQATSIPSASVSTPTARVRLSLRLSREQARTIASAAKAAGLAAGDYIAGLAADVPVLSNGGSRGDHLAALIASSAELSTLSRNIHHLTSLLRQAQVRPAQEYRAMLDTLADDVHAHLKVASVVLAELRPRIGTHMTAHRTKP